VVTSLIIFSLLLIFYIMEFEKYSSQLINKIALIEKLIWRTYNLKIFAAYAYSQFAIFFRLFG